MKNKRLVAALIVLAVVIALVGYWVKCLFDVEIFEGISFSRHFPFKYLVKEQIVKCPEPGVLITDSFEKAGRISDWSPLWMREKNKVVKRYDIGGIGGSQCLMIHNNGSQDWSYAFSKIIEVQEGDVFEQRGYVRTAGDEVSAALGVDSLDEQRQTIKYGLSRKKVRKASSWTKVDAQFVIPGEVKYIRLRLYGSGMGTSWFDEIKLEKKQAPLEGDVL